MPNWPVPAKGSALPIAATMLAGHLIASAPARPATPPAPAHSFTVEQAARGKQAYKEECGNCHRDNVLKGTALYSNAAQYFNFISNQMPKQQPGALPPEVYADITAYILSENGVAPGQEELEPDPEALRAVRMRPGP